MSAPVYERVVIAGGSIAGLLAAAALAPLARAVVVIERDHLPGPDEPAGDAASRPGTPQAPQSHGLLASGRLAIEQLLPGFTDDLLAAGAISRGDVGANGRWWIGGGRLADTTVGATGIAVSRGLVEATIRRRVRELATVDLRGGADVAGLLTDGPGGRVTGVRIRDRSGERRDPIDLPADLVVDATGRPSRGSAWLAERGWPEPPGERVRLGLRYATTHVERHEDDLDGRFVAVSGATPQVPRVGVAIAQEDGTWTISLCGYAEEEPPVDPDGFRRYAGGVVAPEIAALLAGRPMLHEVRTYRFPDCRRRRYDRVALPLGFAPIGDAVASFDPVFGQGMSVAALEAVVLGRYAAAGLEAVRDRYPRRAVALAERAWGIVVGADRQLPGVGGTPPPAHRWISRYVARAQRVARHDPVVARAVMRVTNLLDPPSALMRPAILARVCGPRAARRRPERAATLGPAARAIGSPAAIPAGARQSSADAAGTRGGQSGPG